jgi:hypothetical protein
VWLRRAHRWIGLSAIFFVLLLSVTGIALNHSHDWQLDRRYVQWSWLVSALGVSAPNPSASFADRGHRVTLLGQRAYFDSNEISRELDALQGLVTLDGFAIVATREAILLLTLDGDLIEHIDLGSDLPGPIDKIGLADGVPVIDAGGRYFASDADITGFVSGYTGGIANVAWSTASEPSASELTAIEDLYRGRGLTVERLLLEVHSGRIVGALGPLLLDIVAVGLIALSISGLAVWLRGGSRGNGARQARRAD